MHPLVLPALLGAAVVVATATVTSVMTIVTPAFAACVVMASLSVVPLLRLDVTTGAALVIDHSTRTVASVELEFVELDDKRRPVTSTPLTKIFSMVI